MRTINALWIIALVLAPFTGLVGAAQEDDSMIPPEVIDVWPYPGAEMALDEPLYITFNQSMEPGSVEAAFAVSPAAEGALTWEDARTLVFTPSDGWARDTAYEIVIGTGAAAATGAAMAEPHTVRVQTVGYLEVSNVVPDVNASGVAADATVTVAFSRPVVPLTGTAELADLPSPLTIEPPVEGTGEWLNTSIYQFTPKDVFQGGTTYTATISGGLESVGGAVLEAPYTWQFATLPPQILNVYPHQGEQGVALDRSVQIQFSQPMDRASTEAAFSLLVWGRQVDGAFKWNDAGTELTFEPTAQLDMESIYTINLTAGAKAASGQATLQSGMTYTFQTVRYPCIESTDPRNGDRQVQPGRGASLYFCTPMNTETFRDKVVISPETEWQPQVSGNQRLYLNFVTQPNTEYTITFQAGAEDVYGNPIETDYTFSFRTTEIQMRPYVTLISRDRFMITGSYRENTRLAVSVQSKVTADFMLYRVPPAQIALALRQSYSDDNRPPWEKSENLVRQWEQTFDSEGQYNAVREVLLKEGGGVLDQGIYAIVMRPRLPDSYPERYTFAVANANITFKRSPDEVLLWVTDMPTAAPLAGVPVTLFDESGGTIAAGQTDAEGVFHTPANISTNDMVYAVAQDTGMYGVWHSNWASDPTTATGYLYTDRPIYRPGETVYYRGVLRGKDDMDYMVPDLQPVEIYAEVNYGEQVLFEGTVPLTEFGTFSGEIELPEDARIGQARIYANVANRYSAEVYFDVAEFRVPEYKVEVNAAKDSIVQGEPLDAVGQASYYFGGAVSGAQANWYAYGERAYFNYTGPGRYTFEEAFSYYGYDMMGGIGYGYDPRHELGSDSAITDANGQIVIHTENTKPDWGPKKPMRVTVEMNVIDESNQQISGRTTVMAHPANLYVGVGSDKYFGKSGESMDFRLITVTPQSEPIPDKRVNLEVIEIRWERVPVEGQFGRYDWEQTEIEVETAHVVTGEDGTASYTFTPPQAGIYRVHASSFDEKERTNSAAMRFWVTGTRPVWWGRESDTIEPIPDKETYEVGDTAQILIPIPFAGASTVLVSAERAGVIDYDVVEVEGSTLMYELPIVESHAPTVHVSVTLVKGQDEESLNPQYKEGRVTLNVVPDQYQLRVSVTPSKRTAQPRDTVSFDVEIRDATGEPVSAEVGIALTDQAILSLKPPNTGPILSAFYGSQRNLVNTGISMSVLVDKLVDEYVPPTDEYAARAMPTMTAQATLGSGGAATAPAGAPMEEAEEGMMDMAAAPADANKAGAEVVVREEFEQTPLWEPHVVTDGTGRATVSVTLPDNLTTWQLDARALTVETDVGQTTDDLMVTLPLLVRPVTPRFLVVGDRVQLAAVINNNSDQAQTVQATLEAEGVVLESDATQAVEIEAGGRGRVTWWAVAQDVPGVDLTFIALGEDGYQDAAKPMLATGPDDTIPVYRYTAPDTTGTGGMLLEAGSRVEGISLPPRLDVDQGELILQLDPSLAVTTTDAMTYLKQYPHYCIEQTVSRFLPNIITYRALQSLGIDDPELRENLEIALESAIDKLQKEQRPDGGWGWFGNMESNPLVTAYAVLGLAEAQRSDFAIGTINLNAAINFVRTDFVRPNMDTTPWRLNRQAFYLYVLARARQPAQNQMDELLGYRLEMSYEARAFLLMAYQELGDVPVQEQKQQLISDLNTAAIVSATGTHWEEEKPDWWNWSSDTRATAVSLAALVRADAGNALLPNAVRWLMVARQGDHWYTTQETVWSIIGLTEWMLYTGELEGSYEYQVGLNRAPLGEGAVTPETVREGRELRVAVGDLLQEELNRLTIVRGEGEGALYYTAHLKTRLWASEAKPIDRGISVSRQYFIQGKPDTPITEAKIGDVINVRLTITASQDIYYFVLEDPIPAGTEGVDTSLLTTSTMAQDPTLQRDTDYRWWWGWWWFKHTEMRDEQVNLYADFLAEGTYTYTYQVRASIAGAFQTMPSHAYAFYFPEVFGRGAGTLFTVEE